MYLIRLWIRIYCSCSHPPMQDFASLEPLPNSPLSRPRCVNRHGRNGLLFLSYAYERAVEKNGRQILMGDQMKFLKYAALIALAVLPFVLVKKRKLELSNSGREVDSDEIFDLDLKAD